MKTTFCLSYQKWLIAEGGSRTFKTNKNLPKPGLLSIITFTQDDHFFSIEFAPNQKYTSELSLCVLDSLGQIFKFLGKHFVCLMTWHCLVSSRKSRGLLLSPQKDWEGDPSERVQENLVNPWGVCHFLAFSPFVVLFLLCIVLLCLMYLSLKRMKTAATIKDQISRYH